MSKSVLMSIRPEWCELIVSGKKTVEVRKTRPKLETPFQCYIYCTKDEPLYESGEKFFVKGWDDFGNGKVIGGFVCDRIDEFHKWQLSPDGKFQKFEQQDLEAFLKASCISYDEIIDYRKNLPYYKPLYGWHISDLLIYDKPKELGEFWAYNEELHRRHDVDDDEFCCYDDTDENGETLTDCGDAYKNILNCYRCWEEWSGWCHRLTRPPQSWCYVEAQNDRT